MRNFIVSDLHGNGFAYDSIINYLVNESLNSDEPITLYINGDLIDRGIDSGSVLIDVYQKIHDTSFPFKIVYLGGNHELEMYKSYLETKDYTLKELFESYMGQRSLRWYDRNAGYLTARYLKKYYSKEKISEVCEFIGDLDVYHIFDEAINDKRILLTHACAVTAMVNNLPLKINDDKTATDVAVKATRKERLGNRGVGNENFFTIRGHEPVYNECGYEYYKDDNVLNIDGASASFSYINTSYYHSKRLWTPIEDMYIPYENYDEEVKEKLTKDSHVPLVEILPDNKLRILTFNHLNEIIIGNYFEDYKSTILNSNELDKLRNNLIINDKVKRRVRKIPKDLY